MKLLQVLTKCTIKCSNISLKSLQARLDIFNDIWETGKFPESWELSTVIPVPKPGKDHTEPTNYRPIALTSCLLNAGENDQYSTRLVLSIK